MTSLGNADDVALIGTTDNVNSSYNKGPRPATNTWAAGFFLAANLAFIIWGAVGIAGSDSAIFLANYNNTDWVVASSTTCCNLQTDSSCKGSSDNFKLALANGSALFGEGDGTDDNSTSVCLSGLPDDAIRGDIASPVVIGVFGSIAMGCLILVGFRHIPYTMVYVSVCLNIAVPAVIGFLLMQGSASIKGDPSCEPVDSTSTPVTKCDDYSDQYSCTQESSCIWDPGFSGASNTPAYICFVGSVVIALVFFIYRKELDLCARLFKVSSRALQDNWQLMPVNAVLGGVIGMVKVGMLAMIAVSILTTNVVPVVAVSESDDSGQYAPPSTGTHDCTPEIREGWYHFGCYGMFMVVWFGFWALETRDYIVGDTIGAWYWHGTQGASSIRAVKHAFCSHFGTMAYAGLVMYFVERLKKQAKYRGANPLACLMMFVAQCILSYIEFLCTMSVLMTSITGNHFIGSGMEVVKLFTSSFGNMKASTGVWWIPRMIISTFVQLAAFACAFLAGYTMYQVIGTQGDTATQTACNTAMIPVILGIVIGVIVLVLMLFLLSFFGEILLTTVDTIYLCFIIDRSKGVVTHQDLHDILCEVIGKRKDVKLQELQMNQQQIQNAPPAYAQQPQQPQQPQQQYAPAQQQQFAPPPQQQQFTSPPQQQQFAPPPQQQQFAPLPQQQFAPPQPGSGFVGAVASGDAKFCPDCGTQNNAGTKFCQSCGTPQ